MSAHINTNLLTNFIKRTIGGDKLSHEKANNMNINQDHFGEADSNDNNFLEIDEILDDKDLYEQFATLFVEEQDKKADEKPLDGFSHPPPKAVPFRRFLLIFLFVGQNSFYNKARIRISDGFWLLLFKHHRMYY